MASAIVIQARWKFRPECRHHQETSGWVEIDNLIILQLLNHLTTWISWYHVFHSQNYNQTVFSHQSGKEAFYAPLWSNGKKLFRAAPEMTKSMLKLVALILWHPRLIKEDRIQSLAFRSSLTLRSPMPPPRWLGMCNAVDSSMRWQRSFHSWSFAATYDEIRRVTLSIKWLLGTVSGYDMAMQWTCGKPLDLQNWRNWDHHELQNTKRLNLGAIPCCWCFPIVRKTSIISLIA